ARCARRRWHPARDRRAEGARARRARGDGRAARAVGTGGSGSRWSATRDRDPAGGVRRGAGARRLPSRRGPRPKLRDPGAMGLNVLLTGVTGYIGGALAPRLMRDGHELRGFARDPGRASGLGFPVLRGDAVSGEGLADAFEGVDVAYFLIHSMEASPDGA